MRLQSIRIEGFKSLYHVELQPAQFTVLVGANSAGKTNLAEAFDFMSEVYGQGLELAVNRKGGMENIAFRRQRRTRRPVEFSVAVALRAEEVDLLAREARQLRLRGRQTSLLDGPDMPHLDLKTELRVNHSYSLKTSSRSIRSDFSVATEAFSLRWSDTDDMIAFADRLVNTVDFGYQQALAVDRTYRLLVRPFDRGSEWFEFADLPLEPTELALGRFRLNPVLGHVARTLGVASVHQLNPLECRRPGVPTPNPRLSRHGENLPAVVDFLRNHHSVEWGRIMDAMRNILPGLRDVTTDFGSDRRLTLQFQEDGVGRPWASNEVSDGTIQSLALFVALHDPRTPLVVIEEPENSVHPWIVRSFVDACREAKTKQVIVTSHSPVLISHLMPEEIAVAWRREGRTHVRRLTDLDPKAQELWASGTLNTFDILDSGYLREGVPEGFA